MNTPNETMSQPGAAWKKVRKAVALGVFAALPLFGVLQASQADPPAHAPAWGYRNKDDRWDRRNDQRKDRWDDRKDRRDDRKDRWDDRKDRRDDRWDHRNDRWDRRNDRNDRWDRRDGRGHNRGNYGYPNYGHPNYGNPGYGYPGYPNYSNPGYGYPGYGNPGYGYGQQSFTGVVTDVHSATSFDIRVGGDTYNVYLTSRVPRYLNAGDVVRVYGERANKNDIRANSLTILNNR